MTFGQPIKAFRILRVNAERFKRNTTSSLIGFKCRNLPSGLLHGRGKSTGTTAYIEQCSGAESAIAFNAFSFLTKGKLSDPLIDLINESFACIGMRDILLKLVIRRGLLDSRSILCKTKLAFAAFDQFKRLLSHGVIRYSKHPAQRCGSTSRTGIIMNTSAQNS